MQKTILITGSTDGIGLEAAKMFAAQGHKVLLHGRSEEKLANAASVISEISGAADSETYLADLSRMSDVEALAKHISDKHKQLDVLINNAGVLKTNSAITPEGYDVRFVVNLFAPYLLTQRLLPIMSTSGRVVNLSSAAQSSIDFDALVGKVTIAKDLEVYAQSKLAITMWSHYLGASLSGKGPMMVSVNPGSLLATKMVKEGFGMEGNDIGVGADILLRAALSDEFAQANGRYYDNDAKRFASPHADALDEKKAKVLIATIEKSLVDIKNHL